MSRTDSWSSVDYWRLGAILSLMGGFYWAIRGTGGFGGESGGMLAGAGWGLWWLLASAKGLDAVRRPYGSPWAFTAITMGIAFGGFTGYGVYISWLNGKFYLYYPENPRDIAPWIGFLMLFLSGLQWGGITGVFLSWCAPAVPVTWRTWCIRLAAGLGAGYFGLWLIKAYPGLYLPFYSEGIYDVVDPRGVPRPVYQFEPIASNLAAYLGFMAVELLRRDFRAVKVMLTLGLGFALPFCVGAVWHTFQGSSLPLGWWKHWEMSIGLGGGAALGLAFWLFNRPGEAERPPLGTWSSRFFAFGGPMWLVLLNLCAGALEGRARLHDLEAPGALLPVFMVLCAVPVFLQRDGQRMLDLRTGNDNLLRMPFLIGQASILLAAAIVAIPPQIELGTAVILGCYAVYLTASGILAWRLFRR